MQPDVYMWRDALDKNQFWIGVQSSNKRDYCGWLPVFIDGVQLVGTLAVGMDVTPIVAPPGRFAHHGAINLILAHKKTVRRR